MAYPAITAATRLTAAFLSSMQPLTALKTADETVTNSTTNINDAQLKLNVEAGATYMLTGFLLYSAHQDADIKMGWTVPSSGSLNWACHASTQSQTGGIASLGVVVDRQAAGFTTFPLGGFGLENTTWMTAGLWGTLTTGSAGTVQLNWGQRVAHATGSIMRAGSWLRAERVA